MESNRVAKAKVLQDMLGLMNAMECKLGLLDALDRDVTTEDCMDLHDQVATMAHSMARLTGAVNRAQGVVGVDAELKALFGEAA